MMPFSVDRISTPTERIKRIMINFYTMSYEYYLKILQHNYRCYLALRER